MRQAIATVKKTKEIQEKYKVFTKKSFGQNFIIEPGIVEKIANAAIQSRDELVFEIGPGIGALTQFLCEKSNQVVAFEIDERLPVVLENEIGFDHLQIVLEDILKVDIDEKIREFRKPGQKVVFASNLPYYITTPIIMHILENSIHAESITVMMQKEVADRIKASPGNKTYGAISAAVQYYCEVEQVISVPKEVFVPRPKVDSAVLKLTIRKETPVDLIDEKAFFACIKAGFGQRRKTLLNSLTGTYGLSKDEIRTILEKAGIDPVRRAETLDMNEFADIANGVASAKQTI
mgnify:CR=1 FL=1